MGGLALSIINNNSSRYSYTVLMDDGTYDTLSETDEWVDRIMIGQRCVRSYYENIPQHTRRRWSLEKPIEESGDSPLSKQIQEYWEDK